MTARIAVIGAGIVGSIMSLELARRGEEVILLERASASMSGASLHNEGKIHLGFVYALDPDGVTRQRMLDGALSFGPILERLCGPIPWGRWRSEGFSYAVMPGSLAGPEVLEAAYRDLQERYDRRRRIDERLDYLGTQPRMLWRRSRNLRGRPLTAGGPADAVYETAEVAIDPRLLAATVSERLDATAGIDLRCQTLVTGARRTADGGFVLHVDGPSGDAEIAADVVVNCSWGDRLRLDRAVGLPAQSTRWSYRTKHSVIVRPPKPDCELAPVTMVQGPFGDVVPRRDGTVYISWYPATRTYFGQEPPTPVAEPDVAARVAEESLEALTTLFPALAGSEILSSIPGLIIAPGSTDVDDPVSVLHTRRESGAAHHDGWWTVPPAKLTTAPMVARQTAERIAAEVGARAA